MNDQTLREILEELRWVDRGRDETERMRRLRWLSAPPITNADRFQLRRDRSGFVISFDRYGDVLHPFGWTVEKRRPQSYRALQRERVAGSRKMRDGFLEGLRRLIWRGKPEVSAAE